MSKNYHIFYTNKIALIEILSGRLTQ